MGKRIIKKIVTCLLIAAVALGCVFAVAGCNLIVENENRVANQELATINGYNGITLTLTQNELMDYYNSYAGYLTSPDYGYNYTVEEAFDWCLENKIKSKYLVTAAMVYLTDVQSGNASIVARNANGVRVTPDSLTNPEDCLTYAEYLASIYTTNDSIQSSLDSLIEQGHQDELQTIANDIVNDIDKPDIDRIEFTDETKDYLKEDYYVNQGIDKNSIKVIIVYEDDTTSDEFVVPDTMYTTDIDTSAEKTDNTFVISVDEKIVAENGDISFEAHTLTHTFNVVTPRATRTEEEVTDDNIVKIGDIEVSRYATKAEIEDAGVNVSKIDPVAEYNNLKVDPTADGDLVEAYRQLNENLKNSNKDMNYYYASGFESAVLSALQHEVKKEAVAANEITDAQIINEFKFLYDTGKASYQDTEDEVKTFGSSITKGIDALYYYPQVTKLEDYFFVYQVLLKFSDEQSAWLTSKSGGNKELAKDFYEFAKDGIEVKVSNPDYDPDFDCPYHEEGVGTPEDCIYEGEGICPSCPYELDADGNIVTKSFNEIYTALQADLAAIYAKAITTEYTETDQSQEALDKFLDYVYRYNDDPGIMNSSAGYAIGPEGEPDPNGSFDKDFIAICHEVYQHSDTV
ncbi:MAG: hypothetical protein PHI19_06185, partial [Clostridia bacterium]|nr:hypothetical protein [Clostridia bacterium]